MKKKSYREPDEIWKQLLFYKRSYKKRLPVLSEIEGDILKVIAHWEVRQENRIRRRRFKKRFQEIFGRKAVITDEHNSGD